VQRTGSKQAYMGALMAFADRARAGALATAFIRRRHLASRFRQLSRETNMPFTRLTLTTTVLATLVCGAAVTAARELPLDLGSLGLQARSGARLEIRLAEASPAAGLTEASVPGSDKPIYLHPTALATDADVTAARVIDLRGAQVGVGVSVSFSAPASARMMSGTAAHIGRPMAIVLEGRVVSAPTVRGPISESAVISGVTPDQARVLASRLSPEPQGGTRLGKDVTLPSPIHEEKPQYTPAAMQASIEGSVLLEVVVQKDGRSGAVTVVDSLDSTYGLDREAVKALGLWRWTPGTVDGQPTDVAVTVEMRFTLK
jgi:protein TonB